MDQGRLFDDGAAAGEAGPYRERLPYVKGSVTSKTAAERMARSGKVGHDLRLLLKLIREAGESGLTDQEMEHASWLPGNTVRPRRGELADEGFIRDSGRKRKTISGCPAVVWVATQPARLSGVANADEHTSNEPFADAGGDGGQVAGQGTDPRGVAVSP